MKIGLQDIKKTGFLLALFGASFSNSFCAIGLGVYTGALVLQAFFDRKRDWQPYPAPGIGVPLLLSLLVSVGISEHPWVSLRGLGKYLEGFLLLYAGIDILRSEKDKKAFLWTLLATYALAVSSGIYQQFFGVDFLRGHPVNIYQEDVSATRLTGPFKHCNDYATFLAAGFPLALAFGMKTGRGRRWPRMLAATALILLLGYVLMRTLSRGAMVSAFAGALFFCFFFRIRWAALGAGLIAGAAVWLSPSALGQRLREMTALPFGESSERLLLMRTALRMIAQNPVFGLGLNTYSDHFPEFKPADYTGFMYTHNSYLQMATECGLLGTALFVAFIAVVMTGCARVLIRRGDTDPSKGWGLALLSGAFGILVNCLFESALQSTRLRILFWILLGAAVAVSRLSAKPIDDRLKR